MTFFHRSSVAAGAMVFALATPLAAQGQRPMTLVDLLEVPSLSEPQLSPGGRQVLYVLSTADWEANRRISHIWRIASDGSGAAPLTNGRRGEESPRWSPDGYWIAFLAEREDDVAQIYLIANTGGEAVRLTRHETSVSDISWSPDGAFLYFLAADPQTPEGKAREEAKDDVYAFDENYRQRHLWRIAMADSTEERLTSGDYSVVDYRLSRDGRRVAHHRAPNPLFGARDRGEVWVMEVSGANAVRLTDNAVWEFGAELSPDNMQVLFVSDANDEFEPYYNDKIFILPAAGGAPRRILGDQPFEVQRATWSADGGCVYFVANLGLHTELFRVDLQTGRLRPLTDGQHAIGGWSYRPEARAHVFGIDQPSNPGDVWLLRDGAAAPTRVTGVFEYLAREFELPRQERMSWSGEDGVTIEGLLHYPLGYQEGRRYPLVVQTHGGPASSDKFGFSSWGDYVQVLAAKGYMVLQPNYRGSTGYGDPFLRDMVGHYFRNAHLDVMAGVDHLIARGLADGDRMAKMGWSAGGHMTNKIITYTDRFRAASSGAGAVNWISMYAQSDVRTYRTPWFGGTPWQRDAPIDAYWDHSPLKDVWKVTTPTLVLVGEEDPRVPMPQSVELYRALKANGVPTKLYVAPREPHGWQELRHRLFKMNVELDWFERHVMGRDYVWETAPGGEQTVGERVSVR